MHSTVRLLIPGLSPVLHLLQAVGPILVSHSIMRVFCRLRVIDMHYTKISTALLFMLTALLVAAPSAHARTCTWTGNGDGVFWSDADNWEDTSGDPCEPGAGDTAIIPGTVELDGTRSVGELQLTGSLTINENVVLSVGLLTMDNGSLGGDGEVEIENDAPFINGSISASITVGSGVNFDCRVEMEIAAGTTFENDGALFSNASAGCRIRMGADAQLINRGTIGISGSNVFISNLTNIPDNAWPVVENRSGSTMRVRNCSAVLENSGLVEMMVGQTDFSAGGTAGGTFTVMEDATLNFEESFGATPFDFTGVTIQGGGRVIFEDFSGPRALTNGTYDLNPTTGETQIGDAEVTFPASMTFSSAGATLVLLDDNGMNDEAAIIEHDLSLSTLRMFSGTLGGSGTVSVADALRIVDATIDNRIVTINETGGFSSSTIRLTGGTSVTQNADLSVDTIEMADGTAWTNNATLSVEPGTGFPTTGTITTVPTVTNNGLVEIDFGEADIQADWVNQGELRLLGRGIVTGAFTNTSTGRISGTGQLNWSGAESVANDGTFAPGRPDVPYARLEVIGDVALNANTTLEIEGTAGFGNVDELEADGDVTLDGTLDLTLDDAPLGSYEIVTLDAFSSGSITSTFSQVNEPSGYTTTLTYNSDNVTLDITGTPYPLLAASPSDFDFRDAEVSDVETVEIENVGSGTLTLSGATLGGAEATRFDVVQPSFPVDLNTGETVEVAVQVVGPATSGSVSAQLDLAHNGDEDGNATTTIPLEADQITNPNFGEEAGYFFANSTFFSDDAPSQPTFDWIDIASTGTDRIGSLGDESVIGPFNLGFTFRFFGQEYTEYWISSNGWISFTDPGGDAESFNDRIPDTDAPNALVAWFWDDLDPSDTDVTGRHLYTQTTTVTGDDAHVITFERYPESGANADGWITGQIVLIAGADAATNGSIKLQYQEHGASIDLEGATVGIENAPGDAGLEYRYNDRGGPLFSSPLAVEIGPDATALPVELTTFDATHSDSEVRLNWATASETNNAGFAVERKLDSGSFAQIGFVEGAGTTATSRRYQFADTEVPFTAETLTYRLKQIDTDGTATYSTPVEIQRQAPQQLVLHPTAPNPVRVQATLRYELPQAGPVRVTVYDRLGRRVSTLVNETQSAGRNEVMFNARQLPSGTYFIRLQAEGRTLTKRLTVVR